MIPVPAATDATGGRQEEGRRFSVLRDMSGLDAEFSPRCSKPVATLADMGEESDAADLLTLDTLLTRCH
jgi:hypothetical protein